MFIMSIFSLLFSMIFLIFSHPMILMLVAVLQTLVLCLFLMFYLNSSLFGYILFLIYLGGMMVLFVYMCSLSSNEFFSLDFSLGLPFFLLFFLMAWNDFNFDQNLFFMNLMNKMYFLYYVFPLIMSMIYLLLVLYISVKMTGKNKSPIRWKKN